MFGNNGKYSVKRALFRVKDFQMHCKARNQLKCQNLIVVSFLHLYKICAPNVFFFPTENSIDRKFQRTGICLLLIKTRLTAPREHLTLRNPVVSYSRGDVNRHSGTVLKEVVSLLSLIVSSNFRERLCYFSSLVRFLLPAAKSHSEPSLFMLTSVISLGFLLCPTCNVYCFLPLVLG